jgi:hypothetical protein
MARTGRPPKPIEVKRITGNPGHRPLPDAGAIQLLPQATSTPQPSRALGEHGRALWDRIWSMGVQWISPTSDLEILLLTCEAVDERADLRLEVLQSGDRQLRRGLRELDRQIMASLSELGFTPTARSRLGVAEVKAASKIEMMRQAAREARS